MHICCQSGALLFPYSEPYTCRHITHQNPIAQCEMAPLYMAPCASIWHMIVQNVRMRTTVLLPMCPTDGPMARGARRDIPGNSLGQGSTSTDTLTHVWGAYGAPTLCRRRAAAGRRSLR